MWNHFIKYKHVLLLPNNNHSMQTAKVWNQSVIGSVSDLPVSVHWQDLRMQYRGGGGHRGSWDSHLNSNPRYIT